MRDLRGHLLHTVTFLVYWLKHIYLVFISENNIHGNYNIVIYINIIGLERKQHSLFGSSPNHVK